MILQSDANFLSWMILHFSHEDKDLGTIRVRARLTEERILPSQYYTPLIQVLMDSVSPHKVSVLFNVVGTLPDMMAVIKLNAISCSMKDPVRLL